jgi:hypothetical protein
VWAEPRGVASDVDHSIDVLLDELREHNKPWRQNLRRVLDDIRFNLQHAHDPFPYSSVKEMDRLEAYPTIPDPYQQADHCSPKRVAAAALCQRQGRCDLRNGADRAIEIMGSDV